MDESGTVLIDLGLERGEPTAGEGPHRAGPGWFPALVLAACVLLSVTASVPPARSGLDPLFRLQIGPADGYALAGDGQLLAQTFGTLSSYDLGTGLMRWQSRESTPAYRLRVGDGLVLMRPWTVGGAEPGTTAISVVTGEPRWARSGTVVPVAGSSTLLAVNSLRSLSGTGRRVQGPAVEAVDPATGRSRWSVPVPSTAVVLGVPGPSDEGARLLLVHDDRTMALHDLDTGRRVAATAVPAADYDPGNPAVTGGRILLRHPGETGALLTAYDAATLRRQWTVPAGDAFRIKTCGALACLVGGQGVQAVDPATGDRVWSRPQWHDIDLLGTGYVAFADAEGTDPVAVVDPVTGAVEADVTGWRPVGGQGGGDHLLLTRANGDGTRTMVAVARRGEVRPRVLADLSEGTGDCQHAPGRLVCRSMAGELVVWSYRLKE